MTTKSHDSSYKSVLDLEKDPFSSEPDPLFYFAFNSFEQRLALLKRLVQGIDILILVIGEPGSGKTTLLQRYLSSSDKVWEPGKIRTYSAVAESQDPDGHSGRPAYVQLDSIEPIVIVDDAHRLTREELIFLLREAIVPGSSQMIKRLILLGESELLTTMKNFAGTIIGETTINKIYMPELTGEEAAAYLQHRLRVAGYKGDSPFSSSVVEKIRKLSGGFPGSMNKNADQWLIDNYSGAEKHKSAFGQPATSSRHVLPWVAVGFAVLLVAFILYYAYSKTTGQQTAAGKTVGGIFRAKIPQNPESVATVFRAKIPAGQQIIKPIAKTKVPPPLEEKPVSSQPVFSAPEQKEPIAEMTPTMEKVEPLPQIAEPTENPPVVKQEIQPPLQEPQPAPEPAEKIALSREQAQPLPVAAPEVKGEVAEKAETRSIRREDWLLSQDSGYFTIQIMGVSHESMLPDFVKKNRLLEQNEIAYYKTTFRGKPWFQLLYGIYPSKEEARLAAKKLPGYIRKLKPWIRSLSTVQKSIRSAR